jgi:hypothetical protein
LKANQWYNFGKYFGGNKKGTLTNQFINQYVDQQVLKDAKETDGGHAVLLTSYDTASMRLLNSWGSGWADGGFFKVENHSVLKPTYIDIFWYISDLSKNENDTFIKDQAQILNREMEFMKSTLDKT